MKIEPAIEQHIQSRFEKLTSAPAESREPLFIDLCKTLVRYKNEGKLTEEDAAYRMVGCIFLDGLESPECDTILALAGDMEIPRTSNYCSSQPWDKKTADARKEQE